MCSPVHLAQEKKKEGNEMKETIVIKSTREGKYTRGKCYKIAFPHKVRKVEFYDKDKGEFAYELRFGGTLKAWRDSMTAAARNGDNDNLLPTGVVIDARRPRARADARRRPSPQRCRGGWR